jgi:hypothetical protein
MLKKSASGVLAGRCLHHLGGVHEQAALVGAA